MKVGKPSGWGVVWPQDSKHLWETSMRAVGDPLDLYLLMVIHQEEVLSCLFYKAETRPRTDPLLVLAWGPIMARP